MRSATSEIVNRYTSVDLQLLAVHLWFFVEEVHTPPHLRHLIIDFALIIFIVYIYSYS